MEVIVLFSKTPYAAEDYFDRKRGGDFYVIKAVDRNFKPIPILELKLEVQKLLVHANEHKGDTFRIVSGKNYAASMSGHKEKDKALLFRLSPANCVLPVTWGAFLGKEESLDSKRTVPSLKPKQERGVEIELDM